jgi:hypothetical protein
MCCEIYLREIGNSSAVRWVTTVLSYKELAMCQGSTLRCSMLSWSSFSPFSVFIASPRDIPVVVDLDSEVLGILDERSKLRVKRNDREGELITEWRNFNSRSTYHSQSLKKKSLETDSQRHLGYTRMTST